MTSRRSGTAVRLALGLLIIAGLVLAGRSLGGLVPALADKVERLGTLAPVAFIAVYIVATVAFVPGSLLTLAAGALFGLVRGTAYVLVGATLGACAAFLIARYAARGLVERRFLGSARFAALDTALARQGRKIVFLLRLSPIFPFTLLNYALGVSGVRFVDFLVASVGMIPGTLLYVYYGKAVGDLAALAGGAAPPRGAGHYVVLATGLAATLGVTLIITRTARRALAAAQGNRAR